MKKIVLFLILLAAVLLISGCVQQPQQPTATPTATPVATTQVATTAAPAQTNVITIKNSAFSPPTLTIKAGTTVTWINEDSEPHKVTSDPHPAHTDLPELVSGDLSKGQSYNFTFTKTGTFGYHCHLHPFMKGQIVVE